MCTYYYLHHHHTEACGRAIDIVVHYVFCSAATTASAPCSESFTSASATSTTSGGTTSQSSDGQPIRVPGANLYFETQTVYCADATVDSSSSKHSSSPSSKHKSKPGPSSSKNKHGSHHSKSSPSSKSSNKRPCANMTIESSPDPTPPSYASDPASFSQSPLSPRCPLAESCPFEQKNRCWNCCWCGKGWNQTGRCSCIMFIEGNQVRCEHICCPQCEPAGGNGGWEMGDST